MERLAPSTVSGTVTREAAAAALIRDIEQRRPRTIYPARWRPMYALRGMIGPVSDALVTRDQRARRLMRMTRERDLAPERGAI